MDNSLTGPLIGDADNPHIEIRLMAMFVLEKRFALTVRRAAQATRRFRKVAAACARYVGAAA